jgi:hypothetical protein
MGKNRFLEILKAREYSGMKPAFRKVPSLLSFLPVRNGQEQESENQEKENP